MQIVIEIAERDYKYIKKLEKGSTDYGATLHLYDAVKNGTPLPKNHGRLIDADKWEKDFLKRYKDGMNDEELQFCLNHMDTIYSQPTIIEAGGSDRK